MGAKTQIWNKSTVLSYRQQEISISRLCFQEENYSAACALKSKLIHLKVCALVRSVAETRVGEGN